ncbi:unnamed protein product [Ixodes pacificus]
MFREVTAYLLAPVVALLALRLLPVMWTPLWYASAVVGMSVLCFLALGRCLHRLLPNGVVSASGKAVLITGCDTGFGHSLALRLDRLGYQVFAGCLFPDGEGARGLRREGSAALHVVRLDVTKDDHFREALDYVKHNLNGNGLWAVVANAGVFLAMELEWWSMEDVHRTFDVNVYGCLRAVKTFLPLLRQSQGRVVLTASYAGRATTTWNNVYSMTKHAVVSLGDGLRREAVKWGISVSLIEPTYYRTAIIPTAEAILKKYKEVPQEVTELYGESYVHDMTTRCLEAMDLLARNDIGEVIDALEHAVCSRYPKASYKCDGFLRWLVTMVGICLPSVLFDVADYMLYTGHTTGKDGKLVRTCGFLGGVAGRLKDMFLTGWAKQR